MVDGATTDGRSSQSAGQRRARQWAAVLGIIAVAIFVYTIVRGFLR